ncbi:MAG: metallophosphoesterase, partial [Myxococcales bacterium]|nr:metallophosphoesterase [Myxococcales bacterium]
MAGRYVVLSDIHLTVPHAWAAFRDQIELGALLSHLAAQPSLTLVLAGDTFDFLMLADYDGFDASKSAARLEAILTHPGNAPVLAGLRAVAAGGHNVVLLAGNHDPEVLQPDVRAAFAARTGLAPQRLGGDTVLYEPPGRSPVWGYRIPAAAGDAWIVHGDRWDPSNFIDRGAFVEAVAARRPVTLPPGSQLVHRVVRRLKRESYGWVDQVKPELGSVLPLLLYLDWTLATRVLKDEWGIGVR